MPAGVSWPSYIKYAASAALMMVLGSQSVHMIYRPLDDMDQLIQVELDKLRREHAKSLEENADSEQTNAHST